MAVTSQLYAKAVPGAKSFTDVDVILDNSYPTGGYAITPALFNLNAIEAFQLGGWSALPAGGHAGYQPQYNRTTGKVQVFTSTGELAAATNLTGFKVQAEVHGY